LHHLRITKSAHNTAVLGCH